MKEIIQRINCIEREQRRRKAQPLARYNKSKVHKKQMAFHKCLKNNRWVFGGNRSGKTECGAVETVWLARGIHPYRANKDDISCWVVSLSQQVQRDVAQQKILHYLDKNWIKEVRMLEGRQDNPSGGVIDYIIIDNIFGGQSKIAFKSCEAGREKFQGASLDFVWFDEEPPFDIYQECRMRVLDRCGHLFGTMTPLKGQTWVYDEIYLNCHNSDQVWYEFMEWADNPYLDGATVTNMSQSMSEDELDSRRYGHFRANSGLIYGEFDAQVHVIQPFDVPYEWQDCLSIDPGLNNPLSCHWYAVDGDGNVYVVAEHYMANKSLSYHANAIIEKCRQLNWHTDKYGRISAYIDSAANQRTLSGVNSVAELLFKAGINVNTKVNKDVWAGISIVKQYLHVVEGKPKLYIFCNCVNMIREFKTYYWGNNDAPVKRDDHAMDELRYYLATRRQSATSSMSKSAVQKDKERLYRKLHNRGY